jgi:hypothetical protein
LRALVAAPSLEQPDDPSPRMLLLFFTDRERFWQWQNACIDWCEWREGDRRNAFGIAPKMILPLVATSALVAALYWPNNGDFSRMWDRFSPTAFVDLMRQSQRGPFCSGPSYPGDKCPGAERASETRAARPPAAKPAAARAPLSQAEIDAHIRAMKIKGWLGMALFVFVIIAFFNPWLVRFIFGVKPVRQTAEAASDPGPILRAPPAPWPSGASVAPGAIGALEAPASGMRRDSPVSPPGFGRRGVAP